MAAVRYVLSHPLCFLLNKFGKSQPKLIKSALVDFYSSDELFAAKIQLLKDVDEVKPVSFPHVPRQRQGENGASRDVDDMFTLLSALEDKALLSALPGYVADNPENIPSIKLYEGDFSVFMTMFEKFAGKLGMMESAMFSIAQDVHGLRSKVMTLQPGIHSVQVEAQQTALTSQATQREVNSQSHVVDAVGQTGGLMIHGPEPVTSGISDQMSTMAKSTADNMAELNQSSSWNRRWESLVPTPISHSNRFDALAAVDDGHNDTSAFIEQRSGRAKRRRQESLQFKRQFKQQQQEAHRENQQQSVVQRSRAPVMIGKSVSTGSSVAAAKQLRKKAIFCIDNVGTSYSANDIRSLVSSMAIPVLSCFPVKPRRRRDEVGDITDRKAFRLCIWADDQDRMLIPSKWPCSITISEWFFKTPATESTDKRPRLSEQDNDGAVAGRDSPAQMVAHEDDNETVLMNSTMINGSAQTVSTAACSTD